MLGDFECRLFLPAHNLSVCWLENYLQWISFKSGDNCILVTLFWGKNQRHVDPVSCCTAAEVWRQLGCRNHSFEFGEKAVSVVKASVFQNRLLLMRRVRITVHQCCAGKHMPLTIPAHHHYRAHFPAELNEHHADTWSCQVKLWVYCKLDVYEYFWAALRFSQWWFLMLEKLLLESNWWEAGFESQVVTNTHTHTHTQTHTL